MKLSLQGIEKSYGSNIALKQFTTTLTPGIYGLLGPNGSGKSTLMNIITDNIKADAGVIMYTGDNNKSEDVFKMGVHFREKIGFMPQYPGLYANFTIEYFMGYMAALKGLDKKASKKQISEILTAMELQDVARQKIGTLSGGMKQRLTLAQAVLGNPEILILDEPTAGLDPKQRISIRNYISQIAFNKIVLIATHVVSDIEYIAKDIIMLKKGIIIDDNSPAELTNKIDGKVWLTPCSEPELLFFQKKFKVTNIVHDDTGTVLLRILAEEKPTENSQPTLPTLEDYYLYIFGDVVNL